MGSRIRIKGNIGALGDLAAYESSSSEEEEKPEEKPNVDSSRAAELILECLLRRVIEESEKRKDYRDESSWESSSEEYITDDEEEEEEIPPEVSLRNSVPKVKGEVDYRDLPPIEDLNVSVSPQEISKIGFVSSVVDSLVVIESLAGSPALDLDSVLFLEMGQKPLGLIFDVIGPVHSPFYCVRFNSPEHIKERGIRLGEDVFYAPKTPHTSYVFLAQLRALKGSDASWENDHEIPIEFKDFSDDEEERSAKRNFRRSKKTCYVPPGRFQAANNPFYRQNRSRNPHDNGPIRWNTARPYGHYTVAQQQNFPSNSSNPSNDDHMPPKV